MNNAELSWNHVFYLITEGRSTIQNFSQEKARVLKTIRLAVDAKVDLIQIREKNIPARLVVELAADAVKIASHSPTKILINDRADIALASRANGVHLTSKSIPTAEIRRGFPTKFLIGVSTHSLVEAEIARNQGADFATFGPVFETESKRKYGAPQGLENLRTVCEKINKFPIIGLGGIDESNFLNVFESGASGIAAIRYLNDEGILRSMTQKNNKSVRILS